MKTFLKKYWLYIILIIFLAIIGIGNYIYISKLAKEREKAQLDLVDFKYEKQQEEELRLQEEFNTQVNTSTTKIKNQQKRADEISEQIKSNSNTFTDKLYQDSLHSAFNRRFPSNR